MPYFTNEKEKRQMELIMRNNSDSGESMRIMILTQTTEKQMIESKATPVLFIQYVMALANMDDKENSMAREKYSRLEFLFQNIWDPMYLTKPKNLAFILLRVMVMVHETYCGMIPGIFQRRLQYLEWIFEMMKIGIKNGDKSEIDPTNVAVLKKFVFTEMKCDRSYVLHHFKDILEEIKPGI